MDMLLDLIATLSRWSRSHLGDISLALMATLFVLFGPGLNAWVQRSIGGLNFVLRTLIFVLVCAVGYGLAIIFLTPWLAHALARQGHVVAAPNHPGTTLRDRRPEQMRALWMRPNDLTRVLDALIAHPEWAGPVAPGQAAVVVQVGE